MYYTYALYSKKINKFYIGFTDNLKRRTKEHKSGKTHSTKRMKDFELTYYEACKSKKDAQDRERQLKTGFGRGYLKRRLENYLRVRSSVG
jgi:putative endonuclease